MISFTVRMTFRSDDREEITRSSASSPASPVRKKAASAYIPHVVESEPDTIVIYEQYRDEAAAELHRATPHFAKYAVGGLYQHMLERQVENLTAIA